MPQTTSLHADKTTLDPIRWTDEERRDLERRAALAVADRLGDDPAATLETLQMLGLAPYDSPRRERNKTPIIHGTRGGYVNRGCGRLPDMPPCPSTPTCAQANNTYFQQRRSSAA